MEVITWHGKRKVPTTASEYFVALYSKRRKLQPVIGPTGGMAVWKSLSSAEKEEFREKFDKWQEENNKKMFCILENAEPFLMKKTTINKENVESHITESGIHYDENQSLINLSEKSNGNIENADLELTIQDNIDGQSHTSHRESYHDHQAQPMNVQDTSRTDHHNMSNAGSEVSDQYYSASVIDRDTDETLAQQETSNKISEPIPPPILKPKEMFETIKSSGSRPELTTVEWKDLTLREKALYRNALIRIKKDYLIKYEKYLHSLSDPELFKHSIKTLEN